MDLKIFNIQTINQTIKDTVKSNVSEYLKEIRPFISGCDLLKDKNNILYAGKVQAVTIDSLSSNNFFDDFEMYVDGQLVNNFNFSGSNIPYLRNVDYV